jgi:hypothetical protein
MLTTMRTKRAGIFSCAWVLAGWSVRTTGLSWCQCVSRLRPITGTVSRRWGRRFCGCVRTRLSALRLMRFTHTTIGRAEAIAHRQCRLIRLILHPGVRYEERGPAVTKESEQRHTGKMIRQLRKLGYRIESPNPQPRPAQAQTFDPR